MKEKGKEVIVMGEGEKDLEKNENIKKEEIEEINRGEKK